MQICLQRWVHHLVDFGWLVDLDRMSTGNSYIQRNRHAGMLDVLCAPVAEYTSDPIHSLRRPTTNLLNPNSVREAFQAKLARIRDEALSSFSRILRRTPLQTRGEEAKNAFLGIKHTQNYFPSKISRGNDTFWTTIELIGLRTSCVHANKRPLISTTNICKTTSKLRNTERQFE